MHRKARTRSCLAAFAALVALTAGQIARAIGAHQARGFYRRSASNAGTDQPIAPLLRDDLPADPDPRLHAITIGHLLSIEAGLERAVCNPDAHNGPQPA